MKSAIDEEFDKDERPKPFFAGQDAIAERDLLVISNKWLYLIVTFFFGLVVIFFYAYAQLSNHIQTTIQMPPYEDPSNDFVIMLDDANDNYFEFMGEYITKRLANFNPDTVEERLSQATQFMKQNQYNQNVPVFKEYINTIKTNQITQSFETAFDRFDKKERTKPKRLENFRVEYKLKGVAHQRIGKNTTLSKECSYTVILFIEGRKLYEEGISTDCLDYNNSGK